MQEIIWGKCIPRN